jgi:hypothetical protein
MQNPKLKLKPKEAYIIATILSVVIAILASKVAMHLGFSSIAGISVFVVALLIASVLFYSAHIRLHDVIARKLSKTSFVQNRISWDSDDEVPENLSEMPKQDNKELSLMG